MTLTFSFTNVDRQTAVKLEKWVFHWNNKQTFRLDRKDFNKATHIKFVQVQRMYDWLSVRRLKKTNHCYVIVLLHKTLLHSAPLAVRLNVDDLYIFPVKKSHVYRSIQGIYHSVDKKLHPIETENERLPFNDHHEAYYLRKLLEPNHINEQYILQALSCFKTDTFPNVVLYVQGFVYQENVKKLKYHAAQLVKNKFRDIYKPHVSRLYFLPYKNYLLVLFRLPKGVTKVSHWKKGRQLCHTVIDALSDKYRIQITLGVGTSYANPEKLPRSVSEARKARSRPPFKETHLRYFEEISTDNFMRKITDYIHDHLEEQLLAQHVAQKMNMSYSHFCRYFKKEMGKSFSEYVSFARLQRAVWMLRHSDDTIEEISHDVGFNTPNYFSAMFKKYVSITPREYRQTMEIHFV